MTRNQLISMLQKTYKPTEKIMIKASNGELREINQFDECVISIDIIENSFDSEEMELGETVGVIGFGNY